MSVVCGLWALLAAVFRPSFGAMFAQLEVVWAHLGTTLALEAMLTHLGLCSLIWKLIYFRVLSWVSFDLPDHCKRTLSALLQAGNGCSDLHTVPCEGRDVRDDPLVEM